ncbi:MAG: tyrosine-type recombinase/integrase [Bacteriovoracia bacterium]
MAVSQYEHNGHVLWQAYVDVKSSRRPNLRLQRRMRGLASEQAAIQEEKKLHLELSKQVAKLELKGATWEEIIDDWEHDKLTYGLENLVRTTIVDYAALVRGWTRIWFGKSAEDLNRGDGREVLRFAQEAGKNTAFLRKLRNTINKIYCWGIEERYVTGVHHSPVYGIDIGKDKEEKLPEILTLSEIKTFLTRSKERGHRWYKVWTVALLTGMRSGELHALPWANVELIPEEEARKQESLPTNKRRYGLIRVVLTYNGRFKATGPTKGGYWRTVPISGELYWFLVELKKETGNSSHVLPRFGDWDRGMQAAVLRKFCLDEGLTSIKFHTLRACFATQIISSGVPPTTVMKICGWKDLKTMQRYIRMAGIDEQGATETMRLLHTSDDQVMDHVVNLLEFKNTAPSARMS